MDYMTDSMYHISDPCMSKSDISKSLKLLKIHKKVYIGGVDGGILRDHLMSLKHGLTFLGRFLDVSRNEDLIERIQHVVSIVKQKLYLLRYLGKDESLIMNLEHAYADLREQMKNVIIEPRTNEYDLKFLEVLTLPVDSSETSLFLREKIQKLMSSNCKVDQIANMMKELEDIKKMLTLLDPVFEYADDVGKEKKIYTEIAVVIDRVTCFIYMSTVGKIDDEMILSLKNSVSDLIIEEAQIMKMYLILDIYSIKNLESHVSMSLRLLEWNKKCYIGAETGVSLEDHFMSIEHGLQFLDMFLKISRENQEAGNLTLGIQHLVATMKHKLYSLSHNLIENLEHAYGELREEMQDIVIKPGTADYYNTLFPKTLKKSYYFSETRDFLLEEIRTLVTSSCKGDQISPMVEELEALRKTLTSLIPFFDYFSLNEEEEEEQEEEQEEKIFAALTTFVDRATCLIYLSFVGKLNEDMLVSVRKNLSLLIDETEIKEMSLALRIIFEDDLDSYNEVSLSLLMRREEYLMGTISEAMLKDHIMSMKYGNEFLKWLSKIYIDRDLDRRIILLAQNVKQKLESLTYEQRDGSLNVDLNRVYGDLRKEMENVIINPTNKKWYTLFPELSPGIYHYDFLVEKITILVTSNCKADQIAPLKKELQDLRKILTFLKPLGLFNCGMDPTISTFHHKATFFIYLSYVGKMDIEMVLSARRNILIAIEETDVRELYTMILNEVLFKSQYLEEELYLLENLILLLKSNVEALNDACSMLYEVLIGIHSFLLCLSPNMLLRKLHLLHPSFQAILGYSIPIVCSCYMEHTEVDVSDKLNCILDLIERIKSESQEIKLYYFPRADDLGFLEFFTLYLKDLMKTQEISVKEEICALHFEVDSLLSLAKTTNEEELKRTPWNDIINMAYQAEYIVDHYLVTSSRDLGLISSLSKIIEQLQNIRTDMHGLSCKSLPAQDISASSDPQVLGKTIQASDIAAIVGFQDEARIMEYLLKGENKLDVISIVGMAGVGKTTLALSLYKDPSVVNHFDILAWCTISHSYQYRDLLLSILDQVNPFDEVNHMKDQALADHLCRSLKKRRYLIVLDDIWDTTLWNYLKRYLPDGREGSRVLITTRNWDVADQIGSKVNELHGLSDEKSWELFQKKLLQKESLPDDLLRISKRIVKHCKGLPLSIVIIAGILSDIGRTKKKWNQIAKSVSSFVLSDPQGKCRIILELSYNHLPNHLRSCFLYLGSFPEDKVISVNRLISLWIAEGLVRDTKSNSAEELVKKYMEDLTAKSLVIPAKERSGGGVKTFRLHGLLRDFCLDKAKENHFFTLLDKRNYSRPLQDPRRLIINGPRIDGLSFSCHSIRSMICFNSLEASEIEKRIGSCDMVLLKVLEVGKVRSNRFPNISGLVHLRYLAMGLLNWKTSVLPSFVSKLQHLEILILKCRGVIEVPDSIWDMVNLRHVGISREASLQVNSERLENSSSLLENLRSLSNARVSCGDSMWLNKLTGLQRLCCVFVNAPIDNHFQKLSFYGHLTSLKVQNEAGRKQRFKSTCQLPISLRELTLSQFFLTSNDISEIGRQLPHLEVLKVYSCYVPFKCEWNVDDEDFPELKVLKLTSLNISKWSVSDNPFPSLEQLWLEKCCSLDNIPLDFGSLPKLRLVSVRKCAPHVDSSARKIEELQHEDQNTEMKVFIYPKK